LPDLISDHDTGLLVRPKDANGLATAVLHLLRNPEIARTIGENAMMVARERFAAKRLLRDVDRLYKQLLGARAVSHGTAAQSLTQG
jgi:glycosyltransferase involved in cell wall biosynthesis